MSENEKRDAYCDRQRLLREVEDLRRDVGEIRTTAKDLELDSRDNMPGPFELVPVTESITDLQRTTQEAVGALSEHVAGAIGSSSAEIVDALRDGLELARERAMRDQEDTRIVFEGLIEEAQETRYVVEDIKSLAELNLTALGACLAVEVAQGKMLGNIGDTLLNINDAVSGLQVSLDEGLGKVVDRIIGLEETTIEVGACVSEQIRVSSEYTARATYEVGACLQGAMVGVGDRVCKQIQFSSEQVACVISQNISAIGQHIHAAQVEGTGRVLTALQVMEERAQSRHDELVVEVKKGLANEADEKYTQAMTLFRAGEFGHAVRELRSEVFKRDSTHVPGWILFGHCCESRGRPAEAKSAFRRAAKYALILKRVEDFETAIVHLARLEHMVGNVEIAKDTMLEAQDSASKAGYKVSPYFKYELFKHKFMCTSVGFDKKSQNYRKWLVKQARVLRDTVLRQAPELREEVKLHPLFVEMIQVAPFIGWGNVPYIRLAEFVYDHFSPAGPDRVAPRYEMDPQKRPKCYKCFEWSAQVLDTVLRFIERGAKEHPEDLRECLTRVQTLVVAFEEAVKAHPVNERDGFYGKMMEEIRGNHNGRYEFKWLFETLLVFVFENIEGASAIEISGEGWNIAAVKDVETLDGFEREWADSMSIVVWHGLFTIWFLNQLEPTEKNNEKTERFFIFHSLRIAFATYPKIREAFEKGKWPVLLARYNACQRRRKEEEDLKKRREAEDIKRKKEAEELEKKRAAEEAKKKREEDNKGVCEYLKREFGEWRKDRRWHKFLITKEIYTNWRGETFRQFMEMRRSIERMTYLEQESKLDVFAEQIEVRIKKMKYSSYDFGEDEATGERHPLHFQTKRVMTLFVDALRYRIDISDPQLFREAFFTGWM